MPTGIEEALAAVAAVLASALEAGAISAFAGTPDPAGSAMEASDASAYGSSLAEHSPDVLEGDPGPMDAPVTGDRPADSDALRHHRFDFEPALIDAARPRGGDDPADAPTATPRLLPPSAEPKAADSAPDVSPATPIVPQPPGFQNDPTVPPAGEAESGPPNGPGNPPLSEIPDAPWTAGLADRWEQDVSYTWSGLLFGESGEKVNQRAKQAVEDWLTKNLLDDASDQSEGLRFAKVLAATVLKSASDAGLDMVVTPVLDPGTIPRGIMRTGTVSAQGVEDIEQGRILEGSVKIVGEVSGTLLIVLAPVRGGTVKSTAKVPKAGAPAEPSITLSLERHPTPTSRAALREANRAHNVVEVSRPEGVVRTHLVEEILGEPGKETKIAKVTRYSDAPEAPSYDSFTRPMSAAEAQKSIAAMDRALASTYEGVPGGVGPYGTRFEHCATHAAAVAQAGGIWTTGRLGPHINFFLFKYMGPLGTQNAAAVVAGSQTVNDNYPH